MSAIGPVPLAESYILPHVDLRKPDEVEDKAPDEPSLRMSETQSETPSVEDDWFGESFEVVVEARSVKVRQLKLPMPEPVVSALKYYFKVADAFYKNDIEILKTLSDDEHDVFLHTPLGEDHDDWSFLLVGALKSLEIECLAARMQVAVTLDRKEVWIGGKRINWTLRP